MIESSESQWGGRWVPTQTAQCVWRVVIAGPPLNSLQLRVGLGGEISGGAGGGGVKAIFFSFHFSERVSCYLVIILSSLNDARLHSHLGNERRKRRGQKIARRRGWVLSGGATGAALHAWLTRCHTLLSTLLSRSRFFFWTLWLCALACSALTSAPRGCVRGRSGGTRKLARVSRRAHWHISAEHTRNSALFFFPLFTDELRAFRIIIFLKI